jgi:hypothetical protein
MTGIEVDASQLHAFAARLEQAGRITEREARGVIAKGAVNIKNRLREQMSASRHFAPVARAISYDLREVGAFGGGIIEAEIGPETGAPGSLANIAYFGTSRGGGTVPDPQGALDAEAPAVERWLGDLAEREI